MEGVPVQLADGRSQGLPPVTEEQLRGDPGCVLCGSGRVLTVGLLSVLCREQGRWDWALPAGRVHSWPHCLKEWLHWGPPKEQERLKLLPLPGLRDICDLSVLSVKTFPSWG